MNMLKSVFTKRIWPYYCGVSSHFRNCVVHGSQPASKAGQMRLLHSPTSEKLTPDPLRLPKTGNDSDEAFSTCYDMNSENYDILKNKYVKIMEEVYQGGGEKGIQRHVQRNKKILVRDRIKHICDQESPFVEIGAMAGHFMEYGRVASAGAVCGIGKIHGIWCMIMANDATVKSGAIYPITCKKQLHCQRMSLENFLPAIYLIDSAGAFLPMQAEIFNVGGIAFYNQAVMSSKGMPQISLVCGSCTAGAAYIPSMSEEAAIVDKIGTVYLGGPPLVQAATGEIVTPEQLGGADVHCRLSGVTDHFVNNEYEGFDTVRNVMATTNFQGVPTPVPLEPDEEMKKFAVASPEYCTSVYKLIERLADHGGFQEFRAKYGPTLITGFMFVNEELVGVVANNGYMTDKAAQKAAHFLQLCSNRQIPVAFLQNMTFDEYEESSRLQTANVIKARAALMQAIVKCSSPKVVISVGGLVGSPHMHNMCSMSMGARFHFLWPNVRLGPHFPWRTLEADDASEISISEYAASKDETTAFHGASQLWYDGIVLPEDTRQTLYYCLNIFKQESAARARNKGSCDPANSSLIHTVLRM